MTIKEANLTLMVRNMDASVAFYQSLGIMVKNRWGNHYAQLSAPGVTIGLHPSDKGVTGSSGNASIGFTVDNIEEGRKLLASKSIALTERKEEGGQFLHFADPDGTALYFIKPKW